jgi:hypothetical protein
MRGVQCVGCYAQGRVCGELRTMHGALAVLRSGYCLITSAPEGGLKLNASSAITVLASTF